MNNNNERSILVTGGSGYIAGFIIIELLSKNVHVKTTLRNLAKAEAVKSQLLQGGAKNLSNLTFVQADLTKNDGWKAAMENVEAVIHVASPTPEVRPDSDDEMVKIAVDGLTRVYDAAHEAGVQKIVLTSASGAVLAGHKNHPEIFTEKDWSNLTAPINAYQRSKTRAEQVAWELAKKYDIKMASILPVAVMGPVLGNDFSHSNTIIKQMLTGKMPVLMNLSFDYVDVRDVANLHVLALENLDGNANGQRFLATTGENLSYKEEAQILKENFVKFDKKISTKVLPNFAVKLLANFRQDLKMPATFLGQNTACSPKKAEKLLNWKHRSAKSAIIETAQTMIDLGIVE